METLYYPSAVKAGFPSPAMDYLEERINLNDVLIQHPLSTFLIECSGDSMISAFIPPKAILVVDKSILPSNGDIVVAVMNGDFTVKFLKKNDLRCWLVPGNSKYKEIEITPEMNMQVWGVVVKIIIDPKDVRKCML